MTNIVSRTHKSKFPRLMNSEIWRGAFSLSLVILIGVIIGHVVLSFPLPHTFALILGTTFLGFSIYKIEFPFYLFIFLIIMMVEVNPVEGNIFQFFTERDITGIPTLLEMVFGVLLLSFFIRFLLKKEMLLISPFNWTLIIFLSFLAVSFCIGFQNGFDRITLKEDFKKFLVPVFFFFCCVNILNSQKKIKFLLVFGFAITLVKSCLGIFYYLKGKGFLYEDSIPVVFLENSDHLLFVTIIVVMISLIVSGKIRGSNLLLSLLAISPLFFSVIFSYRRHAWAGLLLSFVILFLLVPWTKKLKILAIGSSLALIVAILISFSGLISLLPSEGYLVNRFLSIANREQRSNVAHIKEWQITFEDTMKSPIVGLGLGSTHRPIPGYVTIPVTTVHNAFLMLWMKMGIVPVLLFSWCVLRYVKFGIRVARGEDDYEFKPAQVGLFASTGLWAISLNTGPSWFYYRETCLMALVASFVIALSGINASDSDRKKHPLLD